MVALGLLVTVGSAHRDDAAASELAPLPTEALQVLITTSELVVGQNRFAFGLMKGRTLVDAASVAVRIYDLRDEPPRLTSEAPALYHKLEVVEQGKHLHIHPDGTPS